MVRFGSAGSCRFCKIDRRREQASQVCLERKSAGDARGAGYGYVGGCVPVRKGIALSLMRMNQIKEVSFEDAIAIVEPGVITAI